MAAFKYDHRGAWGFIKNPLPAQQQEQSFKNAGLYIGDIKSVNKTEIIVGGKNIAERIFIGDRLCLFSNNKIIIIRATFPMQTITRCEISSGNWSDIRQGMKVYKYVQKNRGMD